MVVTDGRAGPIFDRSQAGGVEGARPAASGRGRAFYVPDPPAPRSAVL